MREEGYYLVEVDGLIPTPTLGYWNGNQWKIEGYSWFSDCSIIVKSEKLGPPDTAPE